MTAYQQHTAAARPIFYRAVGLLPHAIVDSCLPKRQKATRQDTNNTFVVPAQEGPSGRGQRDETTDARTTDDRRERQRAWGGARALSRPPTFTNTSTHHEYVVSAQLHIMRIMGVRSVCRHKMHTQ
eukprot:8675210-Pyramimonas_sp.AAC.1